MLLLDEDVRDHRIGLRYLRPLLGGDENDSEDESWMSSLVHPSALSDADFDDLVGSRQAPGRLFFRASLQAELDGLLDIRECLVSRRALADAAGNDGALGHDESVFTRAQDDR
jgi:hypothetical protein